MLTLTGSIEPTEQMFNVQYCLGRKAYNIVKAFLVQKIDPNTYLS